MLTMDNVRNCIGNKLGLLQRFCGENTMIWLSCSVSSSEPLQTKIFVLADHATKKAFLGDKTVTWLF